MLLALLALEEVREPSRLNPLGLEGPVIRQVAHNRLGIISGSGTGAEKRHIVLIKVRVLKVPIRSPRAPQSDTTGLAGKRELKLPKPGGAELPGLLASVAILIHKLTRKPDVAVRVSFLPMRLLCTMP